MKMKIYYTIATLCALFIFNSAFVMAPAEEDNSNPDLTAASNWLQYHRSKKKLVRDFVSVTFVANADTTEGAGIKFEVKYQMVWLDCCSAINNEYSWCNAALQDKRC